MRREFTHKKWVAIALTLALIACAFPINAVALDSKSDIAHALSSDSLDATTDSLGGAVDNLEHVDSITIGETFETPSIREENVASSSVNSISDGVYALQNNSFTTRWMTVEADNVFAGKHIQQVYSDASPASSSVFDRSSLFKISHVYGTDRYIIRSMLNNNLSFGVSGTEILTKIIPSADSDVPVEDTFYIEWDGYGFLIRPYGSSNVINMASASNANLTMVNKTNVTASARWTFVQYTGEHRRGLILYRPALWGSVGIAVGTTGTATLVGWCTYIDANTLSMDVTAGYEDLGGLVWNDSENTVTLSAYRPGKFRVNGRIQYANGTQVAVGTFVHMIVPQEGTYYIQNASTGKYVDIKGPSTSEGAIIHQWQYHTGNQAKWNIEHVSNSGGYVRLKSVYSNLYIGVDSSDTSVIRQYSTQNDYTLWKIDRTTFGNLVFKCKATESSGIVLSVPLTANSNGTNLTQLTYTDDSNTRDEWYLVDKVISYVNYYDSTFVGNAQLIQNIATANSFANLAFARYYYTGMYMDGTATQRTTTIDSCSTGTNAPCTDATCGTDCSTQHHKNCWVISNQLYNSPRENDHIYVLWTNHSENTYCTESSEVHSTVTWIAVVYSKRPVIHFLTIYDFSTDIQLACMTLTLVHETAHSFQLGEAYTNSGHDIDGKTECVMEKFHTASAYAFYEDVLSGSKKPFCDSCDEAMRGYTSNIVISGN